MNDSYAEQLIKCKKKPLHTAVQVILLITTALLLLAGFFMKIMLLLIPGVFLLLICNFLLPLLNVEYEYLYVTGELTVDKILGRSKRKNCFTVEMDKIDIIAPSGSDKLKEFGHLKCVEADYTSNNKDTGIYVCIFHTDTDVRKVYFEPDEKMLELMRLTSPRKVVLS